MSVFIKINLLLLSICLLISCGNDNTKITIKIFNCNKQEISARVDIHRDIRWYHKLFYPIKSMYCTYYLVSGKFTPNQFSIVEGDTIDIYANTNFLPMTIQFSNGESFFIDENKVKSIDPDLFFKLKNNTLKGLIFTFGYNQEEISLIENSTNEPMSRVAVALCNKCTFLEPTKN